MRISVMSALVLLGAAPAHAQSISWSVVNNFGLFANAETQARFKSESAAYIACMRRTASPGQCENNRNTFGLTQKPYAVRFEPTKLTYDPELLRPRAGGTADTVMVELSHRGSTGRCRWSVGGRNLGSEPCRGFKAPVPIGRDVVVVAEPARGARAETTVNVRRVVITNFGDSYMSGEGNPHRRSRVEPVRAENWLEARCHRSLLAATSIAAFRYAEANPQTYVAYFTFACSGSTVEQGVLGDYEGIISSRQLDNLRGPDDPQNHFRGRTMPSQLAQARQTLCAQGDCVRPDAIFLSIGINAIGFSEVISQLASGTCDEKCKSSEEARVRERLADIQGDGPTSLARAYMTLSRELSPKVAFAIEYPDPTRNDSGSFCDRNLLFPALGRFRIGRVDATENGWAHDIVVEPLNQAISAVTGRVEGWRKLTGAAAATRRHGYCARQTFFNSAQAARGSSGTMHPNAAGHDAIAGLIGEALARELAATP